MNFDRCPVCQGEWKHLHTKTYSIGGGHAPITISTSTCCNLFIDNDLLRECRADFPDGASLVWIIDENEKDGMFCIVYSNVEDNEGVFLPRLPFDTTNEKLHRLMLLAQ